MVKDLPLLSLSTPWQLQNEDLQALKDFGVKFEDKPTGCIYTCPQYGPHRWGQHYPNANGKHQSPINIDSTFALFDEQLSGSQFQFSYKPEDFTKLTNSGASWKLLANEHATSTLTVSFLPNEQFKVVEMHSHWGVDSNTGAEHLLNGKGSAMEIHIVHYNTKYDSFASALNHDDGLLVLAILCDEGETNSSLDPIVNRVGNILYKGDCVELDMYDLRQILPGNIELFYTYFGSLTAPPCTECVTWVVFKERVTISSEQVEKFRQLHSVGTDDAENNPIKLIKNVRPVQAVNDRKVRRSFESEMNVSA